MRYTFELCDKKALKKSIISGFVTVVAAVAVAAVCNAFFTCFRNDSNHYIMLVLNIAVDIAALYFAFWYISVKVSHKLSIYNLISKKSIEYSGQIKFISSHITTVGAFSTVAVELFDGRHFFLPTDIRVELKSGDNVTFKVVSNTVTEVITHGEGDV